MVNINISLREKTIWFIFWGIKTKRRIFSNSNIKRKI